MKSVLATSKMDSAENTSEWQTTKSTVLQRNKFMFNNTLMSDVKFAVKTAKTTSGSANTIFPAHKYVLATSSSVFFSMFYGKLAETKAQIELPDTDSESFKEFLRFLYCDEVQLTGSCVLSVLYLAKKYMVPSLVNKCTENLKANLSATNALTLLTNAKKYEVRDLEERCWSVIDSNTNKVVKAEGFVDLSKQILVEILERDSLCVDEIELFKAVDRWAANECSKQGLYEEGRQKRAVLGEEVVYLIRFPVMAIKEIAQFVLPTRILDEDEVTGLMQLLSKAPVQSKLNFVTKRRNRERARTCQTMQVGPPNWEMLTRRDLHRNTVRFSGWDD